MGGRWIWGLEVKGGKTLKWKSRPTKMTAGQGPKKKYNKVRVPQSRNDWWTWEKVIHLFELKLFTEVCCNSLPLSPSLHVKFSVAGLGWWYKGKTEDRWLSVALNELVWAGDRYSRMADPEWMKGKQEEQMGEYMRRECLVPIVLHSPSPGK